MSVQCWRVSWWSQTASGIAFVFVVGLFSAVCQHSVSFLSIPALAAAVSSAPRDAEPLDGPVRHYFIYLDVHCRGLANLAAAAVHLFPNNTIVP